MTLTKYKQKRNLKKSGEPKPEIKKSKKKLSRCPSDCTKRHRPSNLRGKSARETRGSLAFVIHEHHASHLHWDLRLEIDGVLKSWAVPKQPPTAKGEKRLAIHVEDHPLDYANFHGIIPEGNYGAGEVKIWDKGNYELTEKSPKKIEINLHGKKLKGNFVLVKTNYAKNSWLWMKIS